MIPFKEEIDKIKLQLIDKYNPQKIILFGSCARECAQKESDIDLCVVCDYNDKQKILTDMLVNIDYDRDVDFILYRPHEWELYKNDTTSFAGLINRKGIIIHG